MCLQEQEQRSMYALLRDTPISEDQLLTMPIKYDIKKYYIMTVHVDSAI